MCDYSLTENPAESDMPTEAEPWQPVDASDVEEKLRKLSTTPVEAKAEAPPSPPPPQEEVDFGSEPGELLLKKPLVSATSALPTSLLRKTLLLVQHQLPKKLHRESPKTLPQLMHLPPRRLYQRRPIRSLKDLQR